MTAADARWTITLTGQEFSFSVTQRQKDAASRLIAISPARDIDAVMRREAIASATYEGARVSPREAEAAFSPDRTRLSHGQQMVRGVYEALKVSNGDFGTPMSFAKILMLHGLVTEGTLENPRDEGRFRERDDIVVGNPMTGEVVHRPPPSAVVPEMIDDLCAWYHGFHPGLSWVAKAAAMHYMIGYIHPFVDGNGRTARAVFYWTCNRASLDEIWSVSLSEQILRDSRMYNRGYRLAQESGDLTPFLDRHAIYLDKAVAMAGG